MVKEIKVAGNSVIGRSHLKNGVVCQDNNSVKGGKDVGIVVVADGAGSKSHSHIGSRVVTKEVEEYVLKNFEELYEGDYTESRDTIMEYVTEKVDKEAKKIGVDYSELASTMLFVAVKSGRYIFGHVGDGMIACLKEDKLIVASEPENGEYANQTFFVHPKLKSKLRLGKGSIDKIEGFVLMSDGCEAGLYNRGNKEAIDANKDIIRWLKNNTEAKVSNGIKKLIKKRFRRITGDDCTLALMYLKDYCQLLYFRKGGGNNYSINPVKRRGMKIKRKLESRI